MSLSAAPAAAAALSFVSACVGEEAGSGFLGAFALRVSESLRAADFAGFVSAAIVGATSGVGLGDAVNVGCGAAGAVGTGVAA